MIARNANPGLAAGKGDDETMYLNNIIFPNKIKLFIAAWAIEILTNLPWTPLTSLWIYRLICWQEGAY